MAEGLTVEISRILNEYGEEERETVTKCIRKTTLYCKRLLKTTSPGREYPQGWAARTTTEGMIATGVVYNGKKPALTHLLEKSHPIANKWGRYGNTSPGRGQYPHIAPAQEKAEEYLLDLLTKSL